ncbi:STY1053 family phage-associated protein [Photorhabdus thracensis]|uniref:STY1053 family phage-associated protein n=1 Tax=Photorhabdus thracensis TaxID=230089 RepID=UPI001E5714C8|nr:hypothetical protein [Photorhabdus thracensis]MCC8421468.1 hypothetical protein [Photorhabdus thracensis]
MKRYMVTGSVTLSFPDGREVVLLPGIQTFSDEVAKHWAFPFYAQTLDNPVEQPERDDKKGRAGNGKKQSSSDS